MLQVGAVDSRNVGEQNMRVKKLINCARRISGLVAHPNRQWIQGQLSLHEEHLCYAAAMKRVLDLGGVEAQVDQDTRGSMFEAYSRVCASMDKLILEAHRCEVELTVKAAAAGVEDADDIESAQHRRLLQASCTEAYAKAISVPHDFIRLRCNRLQERLEKCQNGLKARSLGLSMLHPDTCWKSGFAEDVELKELLAGGAKKFDAMDGAFVNKEAQELKQDW